MDESITPLEVAYSWVPNLEKDFIGRDALKKQKEAGLAKKLVGFERVTLAPGATKKVTIHVDPVGLSYWSAKDHRWTVAGGKRTFMVGASSRDIKLNSDVSVSAR